MEDNNSLFPIEYGDPDIEPVNAFSRFAAGEDDVGARIAGVNFLTDPENLRLVLSMGQERDREVDEATVVDLQIAYRTKLLEKVLGFLGNDGKLSLNKGLQDLRQVISSAPKKTVLYRRQRRLLRILDKVQAALDDFTIPNFQPGEMPLTPEHIRSLRQLDVLPFEDLQMLLRAVQYYGSLINYGEPLEPPMVNLLDFRDLLQSGEFLKPFIESLATTNRINIPLAKKYVQTNIIDGLVLFLTETAQKHGLEVTSLRGIYDLIPLALEDVWEAAKKERDAKSRRQKELMVAAFNCILKELPELQDGPLFPDQEFNEDGLPLGTEEDDDDRDEENEYLPPIEWR